MIAGTPETQGPRHESILSFKGSTYMSLMIPLTPSHQTEFEQVSSDIDVEDFD